jgi:hypothetical protein
MHITIDVPEEYTRVAIAGIPEDTTQVDIRCVPAFERSINIASFAHLTHVEFIGCVNFYVDMKLMPPKLKVLKFRECRNVMFVPNRVFPSTLKRLVMSDTSVTTRLPKLNSPIDTFELSDVDLTRGIDLRHTVVKKTLTITSRHHLVNMAEIYVDSDADVTIQ